MSRPRKIVAVVALILVGAVGYVAYRAIYIWWHIAEAYAAWDTGTLLIEYMKAHDNRWPRSWDDLLTVLDGEQGRSIPLYGAEAGDIEYARSLRTLVAVDWTYRPEDVNRGRPVTRLDGSAFPVVWNEPNEMIGEYLRESATARPALGP